MTMAERLFVDAAREVLHAGGDEMAALRAGSVAAYGVDKSLTKDDLCWDVRSELYLIREVAPDWQKLKAGRKAARNARQRGRI